MRNRRKKKKSALLLIAFIACALVFCISGGLLLNTFLVSKEAEDDFSRIAADVRAASAASDGTSQREDAILAQYRELQLQNPDFYAWLKIEGTNIDYPVMFTPDNPEYYLHRNFEKKYSASGTLFLDGGYTEGSANRLVYGHHMKSGTMFAGLMKYADKSYWQEHSIVSFDTTTERAQYKIIAAFRTQITSGENGEFCYWQYMNIQTEEDFDIYMRGCSNLALYDTGETAEWGDQLLTLSTCAYHTEEGRFVVVAKKITD